MEIGKIYIRKEDMSTEGTIALIKGPDGDITIEVFGRNGRPTGEFSRVHVKFCETNIGGGRSPHTMKALINFGDAIEKDNIEQPI